MFGKFFDRRGGAEGQRRIEHRMPWEPDGTVVAGFALSNLTAYLLADLKGPRGVHVETLMTMIGALAGFSVQYAIWETVVKPGKMPAPGGRDLAKGAFVVVETQTSEKFYFGDLLNAYLVPQGVDIAPLGPGPLTLWGFVASAVAQCGRRPVGLDEIDEIFRNAANTVGTALFGLPRLPRGHESSMTPRNALNRAWPKARLILGRTDAPKAKGQSLWPGHWPTLIALVAQKLVIMTKEGLDPALSMRIVFEAAIPMSKVDPTTVP